MYDFRHTDIKVIIIIPSVGRKVKKIGSFRPILLLDKDIKVRTKADGNEEKNIQL